MKRPLKPEEVRVWGMVAATVHPLPGRSTPKIAEASPPAPPSRSRGGPSRQATGVGEPGSNSGVGAKTRIPTRPGLRPVHPAHKGEGPDGIEPRRKRRIARERDPIGARLDLHGLDQDRAKVVLEGFIRRAWEDGYRAVLIITGKGVQGDGVLRRRTPEWLAAPSLAGIVAGISEAHRTHGGEGALYVALKRRPRG